MRGAQLVGGCVTLCLLAGCLGKSREAAQAATERFRTRSMSGAYAEIYREAEPEFRAATSEEQFTKLLQMIERKLGKWQSAEEPAWRVNLGTGGKTVSLAYKSQFEKGAGTEEFLWRIKDQGARLLRYHVNSPVFLEE